MKWLALADIQRTGVLLLYLVASRHLTKCELL